LSEIYHSSLHVGIIGLTDVDDAEINGT
jgi:hypothetical protein